MDILTIVTLWCIILSFLLVPAVERYAGHIRKRPMATWQRWSIPIPVFLMAGSNLDGVLCYKAYLNARPGVFTFRNATTDAWHVDVLFSAGLLGILLLPFFLSHHFKDARHIAPVIWAAFFVWFILFGAPMWFSTGVPLQD